MSDPPRSVLVVGAGGVGSCVLEMLAARREIALTIVDADTVEERNLENQWLFTAADVAAEKALVAAARVTHKFNVHVAARACRVEDLPAAELCAFDLVVCAADQLETRRWLNYQLYAKRTGSKCRAGARSAARLGKRRQLRSRAARRAAAQL